MNNSPPLRLVPAVNRAAQLLALLAEGEPLTISEFAHRLGASKGTVREVLETMRYHGLVSRDETSKLYGLGPWLVRLGALAREGLPIGVAARPHLERLANESGEVALLLLVQGERLVIHDKAEPDNRSQPLAVVATAGASIPLLAGACGKVVLASGLLDEAAARAAAEVAGGREVLDVPDDELELVRSRGYALDDGEYLDGIRGVSTAVVDDAGAVAGLLLVSGLAASLRRERLEAVGEAAVRAGRLISAALGAPDTTQPGRRSAARSL